MRLPIVLIALVALSIGIGVVILKPSSKPTLTITMSPLPGKAIAFNTARAALGPSAGSLLFPSGAEFFQVKIENTGRFDVQSTDIVPSA